MSRTTRAITEWVPIEEVFPNTLNPRRDDAIKTKEIQSILAKRGWEEPLTAYKEKNIYILLAGHRRLHAAKQLGIKEVPVYIVDRPQNTKEEVNRIASLQQGRVDWTAFEWAESTYNKWIIWGKPSITEFARNMNMKHSTVSQYIKVMSYYKRSDIEDQLQNGVYGITQLNNLAKWMDSLEKEKPELLSKLSKDMVLEIMLRKCADGKASRDDLMKRDVISSATEQELISFLNTNNYDLSTLLELYDMNRKEKNRNFHGAMISLGRLKNSVNAMGLPDTEEQQDKYLESLEDAMKIIKKKSKEIKDLKTKQDEKLTEEN